MTDWPNREHRNEDEAARRRALKALADIEYEIGILRRRIDNGTVHGDDTGILTEKTRAVTQHVAVLGALREVREWDAAGRAARVAMPERATEADQ